ncbi:MAG: hypothetical protein ACP5D1_00760 [Bacteroidales bacterium]
MKPDSVSHLEDMLHTRMKQMNPREIRYWQVKRFMEMARHIYRFSSECSECLKFRLEIPSLAGGVDRLSEVAASERIRYEKLSDDMLKHLRHRHGFYIKKYYITTYSVLGMMGGVIGGVLVAWMIQSVASEPPLHIFRYAVLLGWLAGLVTGRITGFRKDRKVEREGRQI